MEKKNYAQQFFTQFLSLLAVFFTQVLALHFVLTVIELVCDTAVYDLIKYVHKNPPPPLQKKKSTKNSNNNKNIRTMSTAKIAVLIVPSSQY